MIAHVPAIGSTCLGIVIGYLVRFFIRRFQKFGAAALGSVISIILGGAVIKFLDADKTVLWFYPIGLALGFAIYQIIAMRIVANDRAYRDYYGETQGQREQHQGSYIPGLNDPRVQGPTGDDNDPSRRQL